MVELKVDGLNSVSLEHTIRTRQGGRSCTSGKNCDTGQHLQFLRCFEMMCPLLSGKSCDSVDSCETGDCGESGDLSESGNSGETVD